MISNVTKAYVLPIPGRQAEINTLKGLIEAAGCIVVCENEPINAFSHCVSEADVVVILICPQTIEDALTEQVIELASKLGKRIVGVWAADAEANKLPIMLHRHGDATVRFNPDELAASVCGVNSVWVTPEGKPRPKPKTPRHKGHK